MFGVKNRYVVDRIVYLEKQRILASIPETIQAQWVADIDSGETTSEKIAKAFRYPLWAIQMVLKVGIALKREAAAAAEKAWQSIRQGRELATRLLTDAKTEIEILMAARPKILTSEQLSFKKDGSHNGTFGWVMDLVKPMLDSLPEQNLIRVAFEDFFRIVFHTRRHRQALQRRHAEAWKAKQLAKRRASKRPRRPLLNVPALRPVVPITNALAFI